MLLCDDILFWERHRQVPEFETNLERMVYEWVSSGQKPVEMANALRVFQDGILKAAYGFAHALTAAAENDAEDRKNDWPDVIE